MSLGLRVVCHLTLNHVRQIFSIFHSGAYAMRSTFRLIMGGWRNSCTVLRFHCVPLGSCYRYTSTAFDINVGLVATYGHNSKHCDCVGDEIVRGWAMA
jgi:hypothetical protein